MDVTNYYIEHVFHVRRLLLFSTSKTATNPVYAGRQVQLKASVLGSLQSNRVLSDILRGFQNKVSADYGWLG